MAPISYAELHLHTNFSFLDGASTPDDLVERAAQLGMTGLAITDHQGLYGAVRFATAAESVGLHPVIGIEVELRDALVPDPTGVVIAPRRPRRRRPAVTPEVPIREGLPVRPRAERQRLPGHREPVKEDLRGVGERRRGPHLVLLARDTTGYRSLCRLVSRANLAGTKGMPRFTSALLAQHAEGLVALSGCRDGEIARRLRVGDRDGARRASKWLATRFRTPGEGIADAGLVLELQHHLLPDDGWLVAETAALARELGLPVVVTNDVHYALPDGREMHDVLTGIRHGRTLDELGELRRRDGEAYLKSGDELAMLPPADDPATADAWREGLANSVALAAECAVDLGFEQYRFPGFPVPSGETPFSYLTDLCQQGAKRRYHPLTPAVVKQLAHELDVIERTGLAEFFLICWDLMRFAKARGIPAQGRGSAADSIVAYVLGITRVDPIRHNLLFERFINEGRTAYPDVDIDFSSERREEVIQYCYERYGEEHTGMVCNLVTYRARSAVREVGYALGFPRPLVDRVAKALETYDSVMVRRDLEADGGFAEFFRRPGEDGGEPPEAVAAVALAGERGLTDAMGQLNHARGGRIRTGGAGEAGNGRLPRREDAALDDRLAPRTPLRGGGPSSDEGGPGDSAVSVRWLRDGPPSHSKRTPVGEDVPRRASRRAPSLTIDGRQLDPETGELASPPRRTDGPLPAEMRFQGAIGRSPWDRGAIDRPGGRASVSDDEGGPGDESPAAQRWSVADAERRARAEQAVAARRDRSNSIMRMPPAPAPEPGDHRGSTHGLSDWERWLEFCARIDGFPRHLSIHSGGMLITGAPLIDIAPLERATMPGRVVAQYDKRDVETLKLIKLDLLGLGMLAAMDEAMQLIEHDCAVCLDLDHLPEEIPEVFAMLQAADTVGVFQVESRAQMQTLPKSRPNCLDDLVVEVAIIRPGPIQGNAVHPYLRRKQGLEPVTYLHPSLEPVLRDSLGVILYQEQVMRIAIEVAGFTPAGSDAFRRAMGTWRSEKEMEKLHVQFVDGAIGKHGIARDDAEELFRQCAAFASFGFAKSHAAAFARTAYESAFLKLFYPAQFLVGLINAQPMGFYPVEVLVNDAKRHGVTVLPVDVNASRSRTTTEWVGQPGWVVAGAAGDQGAHDTDPGEPLPDGVAERARPVRSPACLMPGTAARDRWAAESATGWGVRLGLSLVKGIGEQHEALLDAELERGPYASLADVVERTGLPEEVLERLIRVGAMDSLGRPRRELLWQLREVAGASRGRVDGQVSRGVAAGPAAGRPLDLRLPATDAPALPAITETERIGDAYAVVGLDARRQVVGLYREALERLGAVTNAALSTMRPGRIRIGGLVVTRQHPMTARGTVFLALEDETGMVNVTLWPDTWARLRGVVRRHALLLVDGDLQREAEVVNVVAHGVLPLVEQARSVGGPDAAEGVRQMGHAGMRRLS